MLGNPKRNMLIFMIIHVFGKSLKNIIKQNNIEKENLLIKIGKYTNYKIMIIDIIKIN